MEATILPLSSPERHWRMVRHLEFDICERSMSSYLIGHSRNAPYQAVPVFPHRRFRHGYIFCNPDAGVRGVDDLRGARVGLRTFQTTAGVWARGILQHEYGVDLRSITWVAQDDEDEPLPREFPLRLERAPAGDDVDAMLTRGAIGAVIYSDILPSFASGARTVRRLFGDYKVEEICYFRKTGLFPIMHTVVIRRELVERHPWLAQSVLKAFETSKREAFRALLDPRRISLAWVQPLLEEQRTVMGDDPWPYALDANRAALETLVGYSHEQGCISHRPSVDELFVESTWDAIPGYLG